MTNVTCVPSEQRPPIKRLDPFIIRRSNGASDPSVTTSRWLACHHDGHARNKQKIAQMFQADRENVHRPNRTRRNRIRSPDFFSNNFDVYALVNTCRLFWVVRCFGTNSGQFRKPLERCYLSLHSMEASLMADNFLVYKRIESQFESFDRALNDLFQVFWVNFDPVKRWAGIRRVWWDYVSDSRDYWGF